MRTSLLLSACYALACPIGVQAEATDSVALEANLHSVSVRAGRSSVSKHRVTHTELIGQDQLVRAACCSLGESFTANPSVDVSTSDAATGARQIKLLGLSGTYVQMLTEHLPNLRGASLPYGLGYVPGPWMQSIQVSKGAASVKNGYESVTGQINVEYLKPQGIDGVRANAYLDSELRQEVNVDGSIHLNDHLSTSLLLHVENRQNEHDGNHDGFMDMPKLRQYNVMHRWAYVSPRFISQFSGRVLRDEREGGMSKKHASNTVPHYGISVETNRYEGQWKNAIITDPAHNASVALMLAGSWHEAANRFGNTPYDVTQKNGYAQLMYEHDFSHHHNLAVGTSINHDYYREAGFRTVSLNGRTKETISGLYAQYTYKMGDALTLMPGLRWDYSSRYGGFVTPRLHVKYQPLNLLTFRASAGKGYRSPHALGENSPLLASGRSFHFTPRLKQEEAWNYGISGHLSLPIGERTLEVNGEYYYTHFQNQMVINVDGLHGPNTVSFENLQGKSYSHTVQVDATYPLGLGVLTTAAFRYNDARTTYDGVLRLRPLTSRYKGLFTLSYKTPTELWQFDVTGHLNGKGKLYNQEEYPTYFQLQAQVTREFRRFSVYVGGENLTNYRMNEPVITASNPWSPAFDATQIWGPTSGTMAYVGVRFKLEKF